MSFFSKAEKYDIHKYKLRLLFGGAEIKDSDYLYQHNIKNEYIIQVVRTEI